MTSSRRSSPIQIIINSLRPWGEAYEYTKFQQNMSKIATYQLNTDRQKNIYSFRQINESESFDQSIGIIKDEYFWMLHTCAPNLIYPLRQVV